MSRRGRFERIEKERRAADTPVAPTASLAERFGASEPGPRVLDLADGQPYVRCAECRGDSHATSRTCGHCGAVLTTPGQRAFNRAFWARRQEEDAAERAAADRLRASREEAERELAEVRKHIEWMGRETAVRRARRLTRHRGELVITFGPDLRPLGLAIGRFVRRAVLALCARWPPGRR
jgi:hypothetical protein